MTISWADPQVAAGVIATAGVVIVALVTTAVNLLMESRRERREMARDAAARERDLQVAERERRALTFEHRRDAYVDFAQTVSKWANSINNAETLREWSGADFDTFDPVYSKLEMVQLYGSEAAQTKAEQLFKALSDYGWSVNQENWSRLQHELEQFRKLVREDLDL